MRGLHVGALEKWRASRFIFILVDLVLVGVGASMNAIHLCKLGHLVT
jgi:hypothetical protein